MGVILRLCYLRYLMSFSRVRLALNLSHINILCFLSLTHVTQVLFMCSIIIVYKVFIHLIPLNTSGTIWFGLFISMFFLSSVDGKLLLHDVLSGHQSLSTFPFSKPLIAMS